MTDPRDQAINLFWDEFVAGRPAPTELDALSAEAIAALHSLNSATLPEAARERVRQRISSATNAKESTMSALTLAPPYNNGRVALPPAWRQQHGSVMPRFNRRTLLAAAAVLLILLGSIGSYFTFGPGHDRFFGGGSDTGPALVPAQQATPETDWPMYRGNPGRSGVMAGTGPKSMPSEVWRVQLDGSAFRSPIVVGDTAYVGTGQGTLYALDAASGAEKWQFKGDGALEMTPAYLDGIVYIPSQLGTLYAIDAATGQEKWQFAKPLAEFATPTFGDGLLFAASETDSHIYGIDPATGTEVWSYEAGSPVGRGQAWADGVLYSGSNGGILYALKASDGAELWQLDLQQDGLGTPAVANGIVYASSPAGEVIRVDAATGTELPRFQTPAASDGITPLTVADDRLYAGGRNGSILALDLATGETIWSVTTEDLVQGAVALVGGVVYATAQDLTVYAVDASSGEILWTYTVDGLMDFGPTVAQGRVYVSTDVGSVFALGGATSDAPVTQASPEATAQGASVASLTPAVLWETGITTSPEPVPFGVTIAPDGSLYVVNSEAGAISIFTPDGILSETWGELGSGPGQFRFDTPEFASGHVDFDADGNIYVFDAFNYRVQKFAPDRTFLKEWGSQGSENGQFDFLSGGAVDGANGRIYTTDFRNNRVQVFDLDGNFIDKWGRNGSGPGDLRGPIGVVVDPEGNVLVSELRGERIQKFDPYGNMLASSGADGTIGSEAEEIWGMSFDSAGRLFVADHSGQQIEILDPSGARIATIDTLPDGVTPFDRVTDVAPDADGNVYVTELYTNRILKLQLPALE